MQRLFFEYLCLKHIDISKNLDWKPVCYQSSEVIGQNTEERNRIMTKRMPMTLALALIVSIMAGCNKAPTTFSLTTNVQGNGNIVTNPEPGPYAKDAKVGVLAKADQGWRFNHWVGDLTGNVNPSLVQMDSDKTVTAVFVANSIQTEGEVTEGEPPSEGETVEGEGEQPKPATIHITQQQGVFIAILDAGNTTTSELWSGATAQTTITKIVAMNSSGQEIGSTSFQGVWPVVLTFSNTDRVKFIANDNDGQSHDWVVE